jgi:hypothetical protein
VSVSVGKLLVKLIPKQLPPAAASPSPSADSPQPPPPPAVTPASSVVLLEGLAAARNLCAGVRVCVCLCVWYVHSIYVYLYTCTYIYVHIHPIYPHTHIYAHMYTHTHTHTHPYLLISPTNRDTGNAATTRDDRSGGSNRYTNQSKPEFSLGLDATCDRGTALPGKPHGRLRRESPSRRRFCLCAPGYHTNTHARAHTHTHTHTHTHKHKHKHIHTHTHR